MCCNSHINIIDAGIVSYGEMLRRQTDIFNEAVSLKKNRQRINETVFLVEHPPVYTIGKHGKENNMLVSENHLRSQGLELFHINRGGDITFHGPGQLVVYPIIDLQKHSLGVKDYVNLLEEVVIRVLKEYNIIGERVEGATGVWIDKGSPSERKICAIGVKCSRFVTMHGLALNVNTDLSYFSKINPCGFIDKGVTSVKSETGSEISMQDVKEKFTRHFLSLI